MAHAPQERAHFAALTLEFLHQSESGVLPRHKPGEPVSVQSPSARMAGGGAGPEMWIHFVIFGFFAYHGAGAGGGEPGQPCFGPQSAHDGLQPFCSSQNGWQFHFEHHASHWRERRTSVSPSAVKTTRIKGIAPVVKKNAKMSRNSADLASGRVSEPRAGGRASLLGGAD